MNYERYPIANFKVGLNTRDQPWILPDDAFPVLEDGFCYRGTLQKRQGIRQYATGQRGGAPYCESRVVRLVTAEATGQVNAGAPLTPIALANSPIRRGTTTVTDGVESHTDNGLGSFTTAAAGTINYTTGVITGFQFNAASGAAVTVTYSWHPSRPVMGIMQYITVTNVRQLIIATTRDVNRYNSVTNRLDDITGATVYTGTNANFWSWDNYVDPTSVRKLIFVNGVIGDPAQQYNGTAVANWTFTSGTITTFNARQVFLLKDRLVFLYTIEDGTLFSRRIRITGTAANIETFDATVGGVPTGAGFIDVPSTIEITAATKNRDDLIIFTESATWILRYTGNETVPFVLESLDPSRGSEAPYGSISYLNQSTSLSTRGVISTDGYQLQRLDLLIPDYTFDEIDGDNFALSFAGAVDEDRDHYIVHPRPNQDKSDRVLVYNYEEGNFAVYRLPLSCLGEFQNSFDVTWNDLSIYTNWTEFGAAYPNWNAFAYTAGQPIAIGGGHVGHVWRLASEEVTDHDTKVRGVTQLSSSVVRITTDYTGGGAADSRVYQVGDYIYFSGLSGSTQLNNRMFAIDSFVDNYTFDIEYSGATVSAFVDDGAGMAYKTIPFHVTTKQWNPYISEGQKIRIGWIYLYVDVATSGLVDVSGDTIPPIIDVSVLINDRQDPVTTPFKYQVNLANIDSQTGVKRWYKLFVNATGDFVQLDLTNNQPLANVKIQSFILGTSQSGGIF